MEQLYELWAKRNPYHEEVFFNTIIDDYCQYKGGTAEGQETKGKTFNAGYEVFIYAFFLGLYAGVRRPLVGKTHVFGQPISKWGNVEQKGRQQYSKIRHYLFAAVVAKTNIDFLALDKGEIDVKDAVSELIKTMNEYANGGFYIMKEKIEKVPGFFLEPEGFLNMIVKYCSKDDEED